VLHEVVLPGTRDSRIRYHLRSAEPLVKAGAAIVFNKVSFRYPGGMPVFDKFSLRLNAGQRVGLVGQSGGGWSHYVGQEKLRPQSGWTPLAFGLDWSRPPRQMNSTSAFYAHTDQWRYETLDIKEILSPTAPTGPWDGALIDYNARAERMGWLPSAPQLQSNPLEVSKRAAAAGLEPKDYVAKALKSGDLKLSCDDPDNPKNWPRNWPRAPTS